MRDGFDARILNEQGKAAPASFHEFLLGIGAAFRRLQEIRFSAPWKREGFTGPGQA